MDLMKKFNSAKQAIYDHVGFKEDWVIYPIDDNTEMFWKIAGGDVKYAKSMEQFRSDGDYYEDEIYTQRFYDKHVYRGDKLTLIFVDTHVDGNKFFAIFNNENELKEKTNE